MVQPFDIPSQKNHDSWSLQIIAHMLYKEPCNSCFQPIKNNNNNNKHPEHPGTRGLAACISCDRTLLDLCRRRPAMVYYYAGANAATLAQTTGGSRVTYLLPDTHGFQMFSHVKSCELGLTGGFFANLFSHVFSPCFFSWKIPILNVSIPKKKAALPGHDMMATATLAEKWHPASAGWNAMATTTIRYHGAHGDGE